MESTLPAEPCPVCHETRPGFFTRYRDFLLSRDTILTFINALLLLTGFALSIFGASETGRWFYLASAVIGGTPLFIFAAKGLIVRHDITAGVMASVATIGAIVVGEYSAAALVVLMMSVGEWLENFTVARADNALRDLARLVPATVTVRRNGKEIQLPIDQVVLDDRVLTRPGERIGVDGRITAGQASINQSAITGESMPVEKNPGDEVFAGTLNEAGAIEICVTRLGADTTLGQIVKLVKDAQAVQAPVQRIANRYARILVPLTFTIAIAVYLLTGDVMRSITVLVVVCPCALVLATPTAVVAAIGNAAKRGILVKSGAVIEQVGKVDVVAFDKTGTLTWGKPVVTGIVECGLLPAVPEMESRASTAAAHDGSPISDPGSLQPITGQRQSEILRLAAAVERFSEHPIGRSLVQASRERGLDLPDPEEFRALPGFGVTARIDGQQVWVGSRTLLAEQGIAWPDGLNDQVSALEEQGQMVIPVAVAGQVAGLITLSDQIRPEARQAVLALKQLGISQVVMITGDNPRSAARVASELGIDKYYAGVLPQNKLQIIRELQQAGKKVAFAGDGVNDAPALAAADVGIAMGMAGTDLAMETADIGLMADEIERLPQIIELSRKALSVIRQNVIFSQSINVLSIFLGGFGIIGPVFGALVHEFSAIPVLGNSARLINYKIKS
jgi:Cd2+/Zn2+-exporting ATPase